MIQTHPPFLTYRFLFLSLYLCLCFHLFLEFGCFDSSFFTSFLFTDGTVENRQKVESDREFTSEFLLRPSSLLCCIWHGFPFDTFSIARLLLTPSSCYYCPPVSVLWQTTYIYPDGLYSFLAGLASDMMRKRERNRGEVKKWERKTRWMYRESSSGQK